MLTKDNSEVLAALEERWNIAEFILKYLDE